MNIKKNAAPSVCPACDAGLTIERLRCPACATAVEGSFALGRFAALSREQRGFLEAFLRARGKIKDVEAALSISYPTVIARLEELLARLGLDDATERARTSDDTESERARVLDDLAARRITPDEAAARLRRTKKERT